MRTKETVFTVDYIKEKLIDLKPETTKKSYFSSLADFLRSSRVVDMAEFLQNYLLFKKGLENVKRGTGR